MSTSFAKKLSNNDLGKTGSHQAGIAIPKGSGELLAFFPHLADDPDDNPDTWITCVDPDGMEWRMRYVWYNGKRHGRTTRDEYRLAHTAQFLKSWDAVLGDEVVFSSTSEHNRYGIQIVKQHAAPEHSEEPGIIKLTGWRSVY